MSAVAGRHARRRKPPGRTRTRGFADPTRRGRTWKHGRTRARGAAIARPEAAHAARRRWLAGALAGTAVFAVLAALLMRQSLLLTTFDATVAGLLRARRSPAATLAAIDLTALGSPVLVTLATLAGGLLLLTLRGDVRSAVHLGLASAGAGLLSRGIKAALGRLRPDDLPSLVAAEGFSFPSGHTLMTAALFLTLAVLAGRASRRPGGRATAFALAAAGVAAVGATRVYLGVHHPSDVLAGAAVGTAWACVLAALFPARAGGR